MFECLEMRTLFSATGVGNASAASASLVSGDPYPSAQPYPLSLNGFGVNGYGLTAADLNHDGKQDLAVVTDDSISLFMNKGDGTFKTAVTIEDIGLNVQKVIAVDLNHDHIPDLAYDGNDVGILFNNGDGTFAAPIHFNAGKQPDSLTWGDFNGDHHYDLAAADTEGGTVSVLLNRGHQRFTAPISIPAGSTPAAVIAGDFNGDGKTDLAASDLGPGTGANTGKGGGVRVLVGQGNGLFTTGKLIKIFGGVVGLAVGDLNRDHKLDLVTANGGGAGVYDSNTLSVLTGNGDGSFARTSTLSVDGETPKGVAIANVTSDHYPDVIAVGFGTFHLFRGTGNGSATLFADHAQSGAYGSVAVGDFDADGLADLAISSLNDVDKVFVYLHQ